MYLHFFTGESQTNNLIAGRRQVGATINAKPETREDLNNLMERLLHQLDNPMAKPSQQNPVSPPTVNVAPIPTQTVPPTGTKHVSQFPPIVHPSEIPDTEQNAGELFKWQQSEQQPTVDKQDESYGPWSTWSMCDRECGMGRKIRMRLCSSSIGSCEDSTEETTNCNTHNCESKRFVFKRFFMNSP